MPIMPSARRKATQNKAKTMNIRSWDAEDWRFAFEVISIAAGVLTAAALIGMAVAGQIARANARRDAARAETELERIKKATGKRQLNRDAFVNALEGQPKAPVQILYSRDDAESLEFAQEIEDMLVRAKWNVTREPIPAPKPAKSAAEDIPIPMTVGGQPSGVTVVTDSVSEEESKAGGNRIEGKAWVKTPWTVLCNAFELSMGSGQAASNKSVPKGTLRVVVAPKPVK